MSTTTAYELDTESRKATTMINGDDPTIVVEVATRHHANRKEYVTQVTAFRVDEVCRSTALTFGSGVPMSPLGTIRTPVARHSTKALEAAHRLAYGSIASDELNSELYAWGKAFIAAVNL